MLPLRTIGYKRAQERHSVPLSPDYEAAFNGRRIVGLIIQRTRQALDVSRRGFVQIIRNDLKLQTGEDITFSDVTLARLEENQVKTPDPLTLQKLAPYLPDPLQLSSPLTPDKLSDIYDGFLEVDESILDHEAFRLAVVGLYEQRTQQGGYENLTIDPAKVSMLIQREIELRNLTVAGFAKLVGYSPSTINNLIKRVVSKHGFNAKLRTLARYITDPETGRPMGLERLVYECRVTESKNQDLEFDSTRDRIAV